MANLTCHPADSESDQTLNIIHDADGNRLAEYDYDPVAGTSTLLREYIWFNGKAVGVGENDTLYFVRSDQIGRLVFAGDVREIRGNRAERSG